MVVRAAGKVRSVQAHRRVTDSLDDSLGQFGIGYFGEDASVDDESEFKVYNTGVEGLPMRAFVICG